MKTQIKAIMLFLAGTASAFSAFSQQDEPGFRFGMKFTPGISWAKVTAGNLTTNGSGLNYSYGLMGDFKFAKNYAFATEISVTSFRTKLSHEDTLVRSANNVNSAFSGVSADYKLQYLQIPLTLKLHTNRIGKFSYYGQFGVAPSFLVSNLVKLNNGGTSSKYYTPNKSENDKLDFNGLNGTTMGRWEDNVNFIRLPLVIGAGLEYNVGGNTLLTAGIRFDNGFSDILNDKTSAARNSAIGLQLGVFF